MDLFDVNLCKFYTISILHNEWVFIAYSHVSIRLSMTTKSSYQLHLHKLKHYMKLDFFHT
jgi:hypothetical protein